MDIENVNAEEVFVRVCKLAKFARSVLHLHCIDLEQINPSFGVIAKFCELAVLIMKGDQHNGVEHAEYVMEAMQDIAVAIVERDDRTLIDSMAILDEFFCRPDVRPHILT